LIILDFKLSPCSECCMLSSLAGNYPEESIKQDLNSIQKLYYITFTPLQQPRLPQILAIARYKFYNIFLCTLLGQR